MADSADLEQRADPSQAPLDLRRLREVLSRRRLSIVLTALVTLIPIEALVLSRPVLYEAAARVALEGVPKVMELGPDYMPTSEPQVRRLPESTLALVGSDTVLGRVADSLPPGPEPEPGLLDRALSPLDWNQQAGLTSEQERKRRIEGLRATLTLQSEAAGSVLTISARTQVPAWSAEIANSVAREFVEYRLAERESALRRATAWLTQRVLEQRARIERGEEAISELIAREGIVPKSDEPSGENPRESVVRDLRDARIELISTKKRLSEIEPQAIASKTARAANETRTILQQQYTEAHAALEQVRQLYTPTHPEVLRLEERLKSAEERLAETPAEVAPATDKLLDEYYDLHAAESRLEVRVVMLERALEELAKEEGPGSEGEAAYERLKRELEIDRDMLDVLMRRRNETMLAAATENPDARVLDVAVPPAEPYSSSPMRWLAAGMALALGLGVSMAAVREMLDRRVRDPDRIGELLSTQLLGAIPAVRGRLRPEDQMVADWRSECAESYRNLRTALLFSEGASRERRGYRGPGALVVTSGVAGEGKTTVSVNLAACFASAGRSVLLVDGDLRRPRLHRVLELERSPGLAELLASKSTLAEVVRVDSTRGFDVIVAGSASATPAELFDSVRLRQVFSEMRSRYEVVLVDSAVLLSVPDALLLASQADATLIVCKPGCVEASGLAWMRTELERGGARVRGFVLNHVTAKERYLYPPYLEPPYPNVRRSGWRRLLPGGRAAT